MVRTSDYYGKHGRGSYSRGSSARGRNSYYSRRGYSRDIGKYYQNKPWERFPPRHSPWSEPRPVSRPRPVSPVEGSEEFMARKIEQRSALIMRQLLSPTDPIALPSNKDAGIYKDIEETPNENIKTNENKGIQVKKSPNKPRKTSSSEINVKDIHEKIMNRLTNLNDGRKKNFINAHNSTSLDSAIQHINKQKRLELSRVLRDMCSSSYNVEKSGELINSIIPDIGVKIEELPVNVIQELRQTLNLDLDEDLLNAPSPIQDSPVIISSDELNAAIDSIRVKSEQDDCTGSVEIKLEDIVDFDALGENTQCSFKPVESSLQDQEELVPTDYSITIKEEPKKEDECLSIASTFSQSTVLFPNIDGEHEQLECFNSDEPASGNFINPDKEMHIIYDTEKVDSNSNGNDNNRRDIDHNKDAFSQTDSSLDSYEYFISQLIENDDVPDMNDTSEVYRKIDKIDKWLKYLAEYKESLVKSLIDHVSLLKNELINSKKKSCQDEDKRVTKKRKSTPENGNIKYPEIKTEQTDELLDEPDILTFPKLQDRVLVIEKVDNQLVIATESGNIIYASLKDGTFLHTIDVTSSPITSLVFLKGINEFIYMYVGSLDHALRIYDFKNRTLIKTTNLVDPIRCMDVMWDYVFMGCSGGTLIRYSTKKGKIEFEEKNTTSDILVLKAAQEGPRKVLLIGHKQAPIYVRDAMSGLYLRNFSNEAITPTVYALIINNNFLYCGTVQNNILVFSFHEGNLLHKLLAANCKGISCMKIHKDLLFSGCYNGFIYVYNLKNRKLLKTLKGPGGSISCMEVLNKQVIVGTLTGQFESVAIPEEVHLSF